jgi:IS605 OrfB family transposase
LREEERTLAQAQRKHPVAWDAHTAVRTALTERIQATYPAVDDHLMWHLVSRDGDERTAWWERRRQRRVVVRVHERLRWRRGDLVHHVSRRLLNQYAFIAVDDVSVRHRVPNHVLAKSLHEAAWTPCAVVLRAKAEWAGSACVAVDPADTSRDCSRCGWRNPDLTLNDRGFHCLNPARPDYRLVLDRDRTAALSILARGRERVTALGRQCLG